MLNRMHRKSRLIISVNAKLLLATCVCALSVSGCGKYPEPLRTAEDIERAPAETEMLSVGALPLADFSRLERFDNVRQLKFYQSDGTGASDAKLKALASMSFPKLRDVSLLNCPFVTDLGLVALTNIPSIELLQLEGTSISDQSLEIIAAHLHLKGINVANCTNVTFDGISALAEVSSLRELTFSSDNLTQDQVISLISRMKEVQWCSIVDRAGTLDEDAIKRAAGSQMKSISVSRKGALQTMKEAQD
jgi:hypothetical protein